MEVQMDSESIMMIIIMPTFLTITAWAFKTALNFLHNQRLVKLHYALQDKLLEKRTYKPVRTDFDRPSSWCRHQSARNRFHFPPRHGSA
jgi:hypothetical protein